MESLANKISFGSSDKVGLRAILSYVFDYLIIFILAAIYAALDVLIQPFNQPFSLNNLSLQYRYAEHERIPIFMAMLLSGLFPAVTIFIYTMFIDGLFSHHRQTSKTRKYTWTQRLWELNCGILGLLLAQGAAFVITGSLKNLIGKPRPDIISRCLPRPGSLDLEPFGLSNRTICTQGDSKIMQDGFRSFPSGHSSSSFAGLFYLSLYLAAKLHVLDQRGEVWRTFIILVPTLIASIIAGTRIMDARHHPFDVLFGSALGILCAWGSYRQFFPPVSHTWEKGRAYPMRTWGIAMRRPGGTIGTDGQMYSYQTGEVDRTANAMMDDEDERFQYSMEPMKRASQRSTSPTLRGLAEDTNYQHSRTEVGSRPPEVNWQSQSQSNAFREQITRNQTMRRGRDQSPSEDGEDIAYRSPLNPA